MTLNQIVAVSKNHVIGKNNDLVWHYPEDLKYFKDMTKNKIIIMGRKTYDSVLKPKGKPLPNRFHIVISRTSKDSGFENVLFVKNKIEAYMLAQRLILDQKYPEDVFVVGGSEIYQDTLVDCNLLYITKIDKDYDGDIFYTKNYSDYFNLASTRPSTEHQELCYETWTKK